MQTLNKLSSIFAACVKSDLLLTVLSSGLQLASALGIEPSVSCMKVQTVSAHLLFLTSQ